MSRSNQRIIAVLISLVLFHSAFAQSFTPRYNTSIAPHSNGFYEYLPQGYSTSNETYPVILFVHGMGDVGDGSTAQLPRLLLVGITKLINEGTLPASFDLNGNTYRYIIISPQFTQWPDANDITSALNYITQNYKVNINRIYMTGLSSGGGITFDYCGASSANSNRLAAIVPIANASWPDRTKARTISGTNLPVWATHNSNDPSVNVATTSWYVDWINEAPAPNPLARKTIFNNNIHDAWTATYNPSYTENGLNIYRWMLQYRRFQPVTTSRLIPARIEAEDYAAMSGTSSETTQDNSGQGYNIKSIDNNDWLDYNINVPSAGNYTIHLRVASSSSNNLQIASNNSLLTTLNVPSTGGSQLWTTISAQVSLNAGTQTLRIRSAGPSSCSLNWIEFTTGDLPINTTPVANAGADQTITGANTILNGTGTDNDGIVVSYQWTKVSGGNATIVSPNSPSTAITGMTGGSCTFRLLITDDRGAISSDDVTINVNVPSGYTPLPARIQAETWAGASGVVIENCTDAGGGKDATYVEKNDWINYNVSTGAAGSFKLDLRIATLNTGGKLEIRKSDGTVLSTITVPKTGGLQTWQTISATLNLPAGAQTLRIFCTNTATPYMSINWIEFSELIIGPNTSPTANAGSDQTVTLPTTVQLNASASQDPDGVITSYSWTKVSGPTQFTFSNANIVNPVVSNLAAGTYVFRVTVTDNQNATATDDVTITVNPANQLPVAIAGENQTITLPTNSVQLDASLSSDPDGTIASYTWTKLSGPASYSFNDATISNPVVSNLLQGTYVFRVTIKDNSNATSFDDVTIQVNTPPNVAPTANAGEDQSITLPTNSIQLDGSLSEDSDGSIVSYNWSKQSGPSYFSLSNASTANATVTNLIAGIYIFRLTVTDNYNSTSFDDITIVVSPDPTNIAPVANAGEDILISIPSNSVQLDASNSNDPDGSIISYSWTKLSGPTQYSISNASSVNPMLTNLAAGVYVFQITITDASGASSSDDVTIIVNKPPVANAGSDQSIVSPVNSVQLNAGSSSDPDGSIVSYVWTKQSGPSSFSFSSSNTSNPTVGNLVEGTYVFRVTVIDNNNVTSFDDVSIVVLPAVPSTFKIQAESYAAMSGVVTQTTSDIGGGLNVAGIDKIGDWMEYNINIGTAGIYTIRFRIASFYTGAKFDIKNSGGTVLASVDVPNTGGSQAWLNIYTTVTLPAGQQKIRIQTTAVTDWKFNWMEFIQGIPYTTIPAKIEAEDWNNMSGIRLENTGDAGGGVNAAYIDLNDWMDYNIAVPSSGNYTVQLRLATILNGGQLQLRKPDGTVLATVDVPNTGGAQKYSTVSTTVSLQAGQQTIRVISTKSPAWNFNWINFVEASSMARSSLNVQENTENVIDNSVTAFPNPFRNNLVIQMNFAEKGKVKMKVFNSAGVVIKDVETNKPGIVASTNLSMETLPPGNYLLQITVGKLTKTIMINKQ